MDTKHIIVYCVILFYTDQNLDKVNGECSMMVDPCMTYVVMDEPNRSTERRIRGFWGRGNGYDDFLLEENWYRSISGAGSDMPTEPVEQRQCSAYSPIWLDGTLPNEEDGVVRVDACAVSSTNQCVRRYSIPIKNCTTYNVYCLTPTEDGADRYCFGSEVPCPFPTTSSTGFTPGCTERTERSSPQTTSSIAQQILDTTILIIVTSETPSTEESTVTRDKFTTTPTSTAHIEELTTKAPTLSATATQFAESTATSKIRNETTVELEDFQASTSVRFEEYTITEKKHIEGSFEIDEPFNRELSDESSNAYMALSSAVKVGIENVCNQAVRTADCHAHGFIYSETLNHISVSFIITVLYSTTDADVTIIFNALVTAAKNDALVPGKTVIASSVAFITTKARTTEAIRSPTTQKMSSTTISMTTALSVSLAGLVVLAAILGLSYALYRNRAKLYRPDNININIIRERNTDAEVSTHNICEGLELSVARKKPKTVEIKMKDGRLEKNNHANDLSFKHVSPDDNYANEMESDFELDKTYLAIGDNDMATSNTNEHKDWLGSKVEDGYSYNIIHDKSIDLPLREPGHSASLLLVSADTAIGYLEPLDANKENTENGYLEPVKSNTQSECLRRKDPDAKEKCLKMPNKNDESEYLEPVCHNKYLTPLANAYKNKESEYLESKDSNASRKYLEAANVYTESAYLEPVCHNKYLEP